MLLVCVGVCVARLAGARTRWCCCGVLWCCDFRIILCCAVVLFLCAARMRSHALVVARARYLVSFITGTRHPPALLAERGSALTRGRICSVLGKLITCS